MTIPKQPIKAMLIAATIHAGISGLLIATAFYLGLSDRHQPGYPLLTAALFLNAPGVLVFTFAVGVLLLCTGRFDGPSDLLFTIFAAILSSPIYSLLTLWIAVVIYRRRASRGTHKLPLPGKG